MYKAKHITALVLARSGSRRLENKMNLPFGKSTVVETVIERIKKSYLIDYFVLATSTNPNDDIFGEIAVKNKIKLFRGSEDDVVSRMILASKELNPRPDVIVRVCSDNPLMMPSVVDKAIVELIDAGADVITPAEFNTYPFGYSTVAITKKCLEKIDCEAEEKTYREHVENYCFENPQNFKILYQKAPESLHFRDLNLTIDYEVDYIRLNRFYELLKNTPYEGQPGELIDRIENCRTGIIMENEVYFKNIGAIIAQKCRSTPKLFCYSDKSLEGEKKITALNDSEYSEVNTWNDDNIIALLEKIKYEELDIILSSFKFPERHGIKMSRGLVFVDTIEIANQRKYCLKYDTCNNEESNVFPEGPIFIDYKSNVSNETRDEFLLRILPLRIGHLISGPVRSVRKQEANYPPEEKIGKGKRRGFPNSMAVNFPSVILVEMAERVKYKIKTKVFSLDSFLLNKLIDEITKYPFKNIIIGISNDPGEHPDFHLLLKRLNTFIRKEKIILWPEGSSYKNMMQEDSLFQQIILSANGTLRYSVYDITGETIIGDYNNVSIAEAWQSKKMQRTRVDVLNSRVLS